MLLGGQQAPIMARRSAGRRQGGDTAECLDEAGARPLGQRLEEQTVDIGGTDTEAFKQRLPLIGEAQDIRSRIVACTTARKQAFAHETAHEIGGRRAIDARGVDETNLVRSFAFAHNDQDRELARRQASIRKCGREGLVGRLLGSVKQMQYTTVQIKSVRFILVHGTHTPFESHTQIFDALGLTEPREAANVGRLHSQYGDHPAQEFAC